VYVLGSLFLLLSILAMSSIMSTTDFDTLFKGYFMYLTQLFLFYGIFIAFAVKTPTIFLNTWLLKAHVESPLGGSIILAAIVLKLSLYGILRLILPILPKAYMEYTYIIFLIGVISIVYASLSTLRTIDVKELIAYSSVSHAAVYLLGVFSNSIQGIEGAINLGLAHGLVSPGLFICAGGVLYDRSSTRVISFYRGVTQLMPLFSILFFLLCLSNCGAPLSLNFIGEFLSLYGVFERSSLFGVFASSSIIFSAAYTIYMYQRIAFGGVYSRMFTFSMPDLTKREFTVLLLLVIPTVFFGIYPGAILDAVHYSVSTLIYSFDFNVINCDAPRAWGHYFQASALLDAVKLTLDDYIIYYVIIMSVLLSGFLVLLSTYSSPFYRKLKALHIPSTTYSSCTHPIVERRHLWGHTDYERYRGVNCTGGKTHAFSSMPLQSGIFTINIKTIIGLISSIIAAAMGYGIRLILLNYLEYDVFTNLDNWIASLSYFCSLGGIRYVIHECLKENTFLMSYCGGTTAVPNNTGGKGSLPVGKKVSCNNSYMYNPNNPGIGGSNPGIGGSNPGIGGSNPGIGGSNPGIGGSNPGIGGSNPGIGGSNPGNASIIDARSKIEKAIDKARGDIEYHIGQCIGTQDIVNRFLRRKSECPWVVGDPQWNYEYNEAIEALKQSETNLRSEERKYEILQKKLENGDYSTFSTSSTSTSTKRAFGDSMANDDTSTPTNTKRKYDGQ
jgi:NADH-ubiquinone oxidoreductase chain 4